MDSRELNEYREKLLKRAPYWGALRYTRPKKSVRECDFSDFETYMALYDKRQKLFHSTSSSGLREVSDALSATTFDLFMRYLEMTTVLKMDLLRDVLLERLTTAPKKIQVHAMGRLNRVIDRVRSRDPLELELAQTMLIPEMLEVLDIAPPLLARNYLRSTRYSRHVPHDILLRYFEFEDFLAEHKQLRKDRLHRVRKYVADARPFESLPWVDPKMISDALVSGARLSVLDSSKVAPLMYVILSYVDTRYSKRV